MPNKKEIKKKYSFSIGKYGGEVAYTLNTKFHQNHNKGQFYSSILK